MVVATVTAEDYLHYDDGAVQLYLGDCKMVMSLMEPESVDAIVCDPPYGLEFMGKEWDSFRDTSEVGQGWNTGKDWKGVERKRPGRLYLRSSHDTCQKCRKQKHQHDDATCTDPDYQRETHEPRQMRAFQSWAESWSVEALRVAKPGAHLLAFGGTRTFHRLACAIEDAGWELRDSILYAWVYGQGFPKSLDVSKAIDKELGAERPVVGIGKGRTGDAAQPNGGSTFSDDSYQWPGEFAITDAGSAEAAQWKGWGTAMKPAWEPILHALKPLTAVPLNAIVAQTGRLVEALLWSMSPAKLASLCSKLNLQDYAEDGSGSVRWLVAISALWQSESRQELMATFRSPEEGLTLWSIVASWNNILDALYSHQSTSTTTIETALITGLRTWCSWILSIMDESIVRYVTLNDGLRSSANGAVSSSSDASDGWRNIPRPTAPVPALSALQALVNIAVDSFLPLQVITENSVPRLAPIDQATPRAGAVIFEPILLARKPLRGNVARNVLEWGTGGLNIDGTRIRTDGETIHVPQSDPTQRGGVVGTDLGISGADIQKFQEAQRRSVEKANEMGRWPANVVLDEEAAGLLDQENGNVGGGFGTENRAEGQGVYGAFSGATKGKVVGYGDSGGPSRFFYCAKASRSEREKGLEHLDAYTPGQLTDRGDGNAGTAHPRAGAGRDTGTGQMRHNHHPTVKPLTLMRWLVRLVTPPGGLVLDPFVGSGSTLVAARLEGFAGAGIDTDAGYLELAAGRVNAEW